MALPSRMCPLYNRRHLAHHAIIRSIHIRFEMSGTHAGERSHRAPNEVARFHVLMAVVHAGGMVRRLGASTRRSPPFQGR